jgi:hypothetical protein
LPGRAVTRKRREPSDVFSRQRQDIYESLATQPFPIRGWHLSMHESTGKKYAYAVQQQHALTEEPGPVTIENPEGLPVPPILFEVKSVQLVLTADFRLEACHQLGGRPWQCPVGAVDAQWLRFANTDGTLEITLDTAHVPPYQERLFYPDREAWAGHVAEWSKKWLASGKKDPEARWILIQLDGIRNSGNHMLHQALNRLVLRIEKEVPDYWVFCELAMAGRLTEKEIKVLENYEVGKGAITIRQISRPQTPPTDKVQ